MAKRKIKILCGNCRKDYSNSTTEGGFLFWNTAICPDCVVEAYKLIAEAKESHNIKAICPVGMAFKDFVVGNK